MPPRKPAKKAHERAIDELTAKVEASDGAGRCAKLVHIAIGGKVVGGVTIGCPTCEEIQRSADAAPPIDPSIGTRQVGDSSRPEGYRIERYSAKSTPPTPTRTGDEAD